MRTELPNNNPVAQHFHEESLDDTQYEVQIVDSERDKNCRLRKEEAWMHLMNSITPLGFNAKL